MAKAEEEEGMYTKVKKIGGKGSFSLSIKWG